LSEAAARIDRLLRQRGSGKTICPSEVARELVGENGDWRARMDEVHRAVDGLVAADRIALCWKGVPLPRRDGPYRIGVRR
jgi:hypothetical protein